MIADLIPLGILVVVALVVIAVREVVWKYQDRRDRRLLAAHIDGVMFGAFGVRYDPNTRTYVKQQTY